MARIRTIKPEFFTSLTLAKVSLGARLTFIGLWTYCDDEGRGRDEPRLVKAALWALDDAVSPGVVDEHLAELAAAGLIERYEVEELGYLAIRNWAEHQRIDRPRPSTVPPPPMRRATDTEPSAKARRKSREGSLLEGKGKERSATDRRTTERPTWLTPFSDAWKARCGGAPPFGRLAAALHPLVKEFPPAEVLARWTRYLGATEPKFCSAERFAQTYGAWVEPDTKEMTDDFGVMRLHRKSPSGEWEVAS